MKKIIPILACVICLISCTKEGTTIVTPVTAATPIPVAGSFSWKENGVTYTSDSAWFYTTTRISAYSGAGANKRGISISFPATTTGVFPIPPSFLSYSIGGSASVTATSGTLTITNYDNTNNLLSGTFANVTVGSYTLTDGTFTNLPKR